MATTVLRLHEGDAVVDLAESNLRSRGGVTVIKESSGIERLGQMHKGDQLAILAHGNRTSLGGKSASDLAGLLAKNELPSGIGIELVACNSGTGGAPFALELKQQLVSRKILPAYVTGGTGYMWVKSGGATESFDRNRVDVPKGTQLVNTPWGSRTVRSDPIYKTGG